MYEASCKGNQMKIAVMQPYFLPYIGYWQLINVADKYVILDDVNFIKGGWINRNNILLDNQRHLFTVSLLKASQNKLINEIIIDTNEKKLFKLFESAYKKAPYFKDVFELLRRIFEYENRNLSMFIGNSIVLVADYLGMNTEFIYSSELNKKTCLKGQERILNICTILKATEYINAISGTELYNRKAFKDNNIDLFFIKTLPISYTQFNTQFIPNLSILDVMMFNSVEDIKEMLDMYNLS